jgi:Domain of unknown function (DUF4124)
MSARWILVLALIVLAGEARAEIYEWRDSSGSRHFTNNKESLPLEQRAAARVFVAEPPPSSPVAAAEPAAAEAPREAQVVYDELATRRAYAAGLRDGLALVSGTQPPATAGVQINGPLAIASARTADSAYGVPLSYGPFVTSSFDRGRSRHLTLRMLLQDQFQLDRDGPFLHERLPSGIGPSFQVFLPRGLSERVPVGNRVLYR